jgi:transcriptional regulator with XRE-family HTH domain
MNVGEKIKAARIEKGMTQEELGALLGVQKSAIAKYESGRVVNIKRTTLKKISDILGLRPAELIFEANREEEEKKNDTLADIVIRLRTDDDFLSVVETLYKCDNDKLNGVSQMLNAFLK